MSLKIGYARVSTTDQNLDRQTEALNKYGVDKIYAEKKSGVKLMRLEYSKMMSELTEGDTLIVTELTRLSRSTTQLFAVAEELQKRGIEFVSLKENVDTTTYMGRFIYGIFALLAQFERDLIVERTQEGLAVAKIKGIKMGRPAINTEKMDLAIELWQSGRYTVREITRKTGVTRAPLYREISNRGLKRESA